MVLAGEFGGFPYGLEPLTLPDPGGGNDTRAARALRPACRHLLTAWQQPDGHASVEPAEAAREIYWFRWITGHQVSFLIWQLMAKADRRLQSESHNRADLLEALTHYVRGYCAMLLYSGSCTTEAYNEWIRPSMYLQHRAFSGGWAPDYGPVRHLFRLGRSTPDDAGLRRAVLLHKAVHGGVAAKLVPHERSLLQQALNARPPDESPLRGLLYDNYFMTLRAPVGHEAVVGQLLRRLTAVGQDVAANGLYLAGTGGYVPRGLRSEAVRALEADFNSVCFRVAGAAAGLSASSVTEQLAAADA